MYADAGADVALVGEGAVQDDVGYVLPPAICQDFVQVAVAGGLGNACAAGQAVHAAALAEPAQDQHGLAERTKGSAAAWGSQSTAMGGQEAGEVHHDVAWDVERGNIGDQREASVLTDMILW